MLHCIRRAYSSVGGAGASFSFELQVNESTSQSDVGRGRSDGSRVEWTREPPVTVVGLSTACFPIFHIFFAERTRMCLRTVRDVWQVARRMDDHIPSRRLLRLHPGPAVRFHLWRRLSLGRWQLVSACWFLDFSRCSADHRLAPSPKLLRSPSKPHLKPVDDPPACGFEAI